MFDGKYFEWNQKRAKGIVDFYGYKFFYFKKILDLGAGYGDIGGVVYRLGADVTAVDARQEHLKILAKKFTGIKTVQANLDGNWPFYGQKFDMILDLGLLCHITDYEAHLKAVCASCTHLILETAVCDSNDPNKCVVVDEDRGTYDLSYSGKGCRPSAAAIERVLTACGMNFKRLDNNKFNVGSGNSHNPYAPSAGNHEYIYDWHPTDDGSVGLNKRRLWFCVKNNSPIQFATPGSEVAAPPASAQGFVTPIVNSGAPVTASPKPPMAATHQAMRGQAPVTNTSNLVYTPGDKKFVIVIPSYKNEQWCERNIRSTLTQNYTNYRVIFTDDCSPDNTFNKVTEIVNGHPNANKVTLIRNTERKGALANLYNMIHSCRDDEIILTLDGDDWLAHENVLQKLNQVYSSGEVWMTYGQYKNSTDGAHGCAQQYPDHIINGNAFRGHIWSASHLRTFYTWLFKKINKDDLMLDGNFYVMTWDFAIMFPMLEMAGPRSRFLSDILYIYNLENPINDHKVNVQMQQNLDRLIRSKPRYEKLASAPTFKTKVGLLLIATNKYHRFLQGIISSADNWFLKNDNIEVTYYILSDQAPQIQSSRKVGYIPIEHKPFPFASMDRFKHFTNNAGAFSQEDYLYYVDVDCKFTDTIGPDILGDLVGVRHCGYYNRPGPVEDNPKSCLYVDNSYPHKWQHYYGGGFSGGRAANYLELAKWCYEKIEQDVSNGIIPVWHDETALNRYFLDHPPTISLPPAYHYPESNIAYYKGMWSPDDWQPKILLLDKNHSEIRS